MKTRKRNCTVRHCVNLLTMQLAGGNSIKIDYERLYNHLCLEPESIAKRFLIMRLNELDKIYNISNKNPFHDIALNFCEEDEEYQY